MNKWLLNKLIELLVVLIAQLSTELLREFGQTAVVWARGKVMDSETKTDDKLLLPLLDRMDEILKSPDNDNENTELV